jgi:hypothetical protein
VEYSWIFSLNDDIPEGGLIDLIFPKNYYNVQDSLPEPTFEVFLGLESVSGTFTTALDHSSNVNVYTIKVQSSLLSSRISNRTRLTHSSR